MTLQTSSRMERELGLRLLTHLRALARQTLGRAEREENAAMIRELEVTLGLVQKPGAITLAKAVDAGFLVQRPDRPGSFECTHPFTLETSDDSRSIVVVRIGTHPILIHWGGPSEVKADQVVEINNL